MGLRHLSLVLIASATLLAAGCTPAVSGDAGGTPKAPLTAPATLPPPATFALPQTGGETPPDPAAGGRTLRDVVKPGATVVLTTPVLMLLKGSVEGTMVARIVERPSATGAMVVRVVRFSVPRVISSDQQPAHLTLPEGTLVRIDLPDPRAKRTDRALALGTLTLGRIVSMRVRISMEPGRAVVRLLSIDGEGS